MLSTSTAISEAGRCRWRGRSRGPRC